MKGIIKQTESFEIQGSRLIKHIGNETHVTIPEGITEIGEYAFIDNSAIISISFPKSLSEIASNAVCKCPNLRSVVLHKGIKFLATFSGSPISLVSFDGTIDDWFAIQHGTPISNGYHLLICGEILKELKIPEGITELQRGLIAGCMDLVSVSLPKTMVKIQNGALQCLPNLSEIQIAKGNPHFSFCNGCLIDNDKQSVLFGTASAQIPSWAYIKSIEAYAFRGNTKLRSIDIPDNIHTIGACAFEGCENLVEISLPTELSEIQYNAFSGCKALESITLPNALTEIDEYLFEKCENLRIIDIPEGVETIGSGAFSGCTRLETVILPSSLDELWYYDWETDRVFPKHKFLKVFYCGSKEEFENITISVDSSEEEDEGEHYPYEIFPNGVAFFYSRSGAYPHYSDFKRIDIDKHYSGKYISLSIRSAEYNSKSSELKLLFTFITGSSAVRISSTEISLEAASEDYETFLDDTIHPNETLCSLSRYQLHNTSLILDEDCFKSIYLCPRWCGWESEENSCSNISFLLSVDDYSGNTLEVISFYIDNGDIKVINAGCDVDGNSDEDDDDNLGETKDDVVFQTSDTLYIYKGTVVCHRNSHRIIQATAILHGKTDNEIKLNVEYCTDCKKFLLEYSLYERYRSIYGILIGNLRMVVNGQFNGEYDLALEGPLKLSGYNVGQKDNFSSSERQLVLARIVHDRIMSKGDVIKYLSYFIRMNGARKGNELAVQKWNADLNFIEKYDMSIQPQIYISSIEKYKR